MDAKRFVIGSVVGAPVLRATGYLICSIVLDGFRRLGHEPGGHG